MKTLAQLIETRTQLEAEAEKNGIEQGRAIGRMGNAIRDLGAGSARALGFEAEADAAFAHGEHLVRRLSRLEGRIRRAMVAEALAAAAQAAPALTEDRAAA